MTFFPSALLSAEGLFLSIMFDGVNYRYFSADRAKALRQFAAHRRR